MIDGRYCADLHVHSSYSREFQQQWFFQKMKAAQCYTSPKQVYDLARFRGMDFVTITDHDVIDGALEIAHLDGAFVSEEISTHFPNDKSVIDVVALNITEAHHGEIVRIRDNILDVVRFLNQEQIPHYLAHPLFAGDYQLSPDNFEKLLLLFKTLELQNGSRIAAQRRVIEKVVSQLTPELIAQLADKHGIEPVGPDPHVKGFVGNSDDHAGLFIARGYTACAGTPTYKEFLAAIMQGEGQVCGEPGTSLSLAHSVYAVAYRYFKERPSAMPGNVYISFFQSLTSGAQNQPAPSADEAQTTAREFDLTAILGDRITTALAKHRDLSLFQVITRSQQEAFGQQMFAFANEVFNDILGETTRKLFDSLNEFDVPRMFNTLGILASAHFFLAPYYLAFRHQHSDQEFLDRIERHFGLDDPAVRAVHKVAVFCDTVYEPRATGWTGGVGKSVTRMVDIAQRLGREMVLITCSDRPTGYKDGIMNFRAIADLPIPEYPEVILYVPPLMEVLYYCEQAGFTVYQLSTPGPVGLVGLLTSKLLDLPSVGVYHSNLPEQVRAITEDASVENLAWGYLRWFYGRTDRIFVSSMASRDDLAAHGFDQKKLATMPRGIDTTVFHPAKRDERIWARFGVDAGTKLLYVGRLSKEKNLNVLAESFKRLSSDSQRLGLVIVGDGPYRAELEQRLQGYPVWFTGYLDGEDLATVYASSDVFVFPSLIETFGNVVLEAQASGLPVVVADRGGAPENVLPGQTGLVADGRDPEAFARAIQTILTDPDARRRMGEAARRYIETRGVQAAFERMWEMYG
ncbi:MAG: glycosyltransferase [Candidatus Latescibacteria bacterium]|nr:glycosyltransferase [Candidatus Latescibacterota bacterium]